MPDSSILSQIITTGGIATVVSGAVLAFTRYLDHKKQMRALDIADESEREIEITGKAGNVRIRSKSEPAQSASSKLEYNPEPEKISGESKANLLGWMNPGKRVPSLTFKRDKDENPN